MSATMKDTIMANAEQALPRAYDLIYPELRFMANAEQALPRAYDLIYPELRFRTERSWTLRAAAIDQRPVPSAPDYRSSSFR